MYKNCYSTRKPATFEIALMFFLFLPSQTSIALSPCQLNQIWLTCITCIMVSLLRFVISFLCFPQRTALASTLRHIGEELYKPQVKSLVISWYQQLNSPYVHRFFPSHQPLLALRALSQRFALLRLFCLLFCAAFTDSSSFLLKRGSVSKRCRGLLVIYKCLSANQKPSFLR